MERALKILVIEDDTELLESLESILTDRGFTVSVARDGAAGLELAQANPPDVILLDVQLPKMEGIDVIRQLRKSKKTAFIPTLIMSGRVEETDVVLGLELGADDYIKKPFGLKELVARIRAAMRKGSEEAESGSEAQDIIGTEDLRIDIPKMELTILGEPIDLTVVEFGILRKLVERPGVVFSRPQLLSFPGYEDIHISERNVDVRIASLRKKLSTFGHSIETVRGFGYKWNPQKRMAEKKHAS